MENFNVNKKMDIGMPKHFFMVAQLYSMIVFARMAHRRRRTL
ncbi:hypothetical protein [Paenibacillus turpanensis]|nr:hypothetical protein [Paenibacillus turpanensis]